MVRQSILVVEDEAEMRRFYDEFFRRRHPARFAARVVGDGEQALGVLSSEPLDLVLLDWRLPGVSGLDILRAVRAHPKTRGLAVIMVTAMTSPGDAATALETGADDYLTKPLDEGVLLARLESLSRRRELGLAGLETFQWPGLKLDVENGRLDVEDRAVPLRPKEAELLGFLMAHPDRFHAPAALWEAVWDHESGHWRKILDSALSSLQRKLGRRWGPRLAFRRDRGWRLGR